MSEINQIASKIIKCFERGGKLLICGNGGSNCQASHLAGELIGRFEHERQGLPAISLNDPGIITAIANDYSFEMVFSRQVQALGKPNDILIVLSTSGKSQNCLRAIEKAREMSIEVIEWPISGETTAETQEIQLVDIHEVVREVEKDFLYDR